MAKARRVSPPRAAVAPSSDGDAARRSKVRQMIKDAGCNTAGDALDGLNGYVGWLVQQAAKRARENGRKTVRAHDFLIM